MNDEAEAPSAFARLAQIAEPYTFYLPVALAIVLALPVVGFTYLWDDYNFLTNAMFYQLHDWFPDPTDPFYRPISRGVFFTILDLAGRGGSALGHILNLTFLGAIVFLLTSFMAKVAGKKAGIIAGLLFACLGVAPMLVGWICCDQDLLAMLFVMVALHLRLQGRDWAALGATAAALLSKETTLAVIPALVLFNWILRRKPYNIWRNFGLYGLLVAAWGLIHPAVRILVGRGLRSGATGYVGLGDPATWPVHLGRYILTLLNVPAISPVPEWPVFGVLLGLAAFAVLRLALRASSHEDSARPGKGRALVGLGLALAIGPLLMTSSIIEGWSPYYAAFPALGTSLVLAALLATKSARVQTVCLTVFLILGLWSRGPVKKLTEVTESNFRIVDIALRKVGGGFRKLYPTYPPDSRVYLSVQARGAGSVYTHMYSFQVLRIWYRDRGLYALRPETRSTGNHDEFLTVVTVDRDVIDINPLTLRARSASGREPDYEPCERAIRAYATGLAAAGETDEAARLLLRMPEINPGLQAVHRRMAAMFLMADGRDAEARSVLDSTVTLPRGVAIADLQAVLAERPPNKDYDEVALRAFGISPADTGAVTDLMNWFADNKYTDAALRFARRLDGLRPGDSQVAEVTKRMLAILERKKKTAFAAAADIERPTLGELPN